MIKAITKEQAQNNRVFPDAVIQAFNELIVLRAGYVTKNEVIERITSIDPQLTSSILLKDHFLDIEKFYENAGWKVKYESPSYDERFEAYWTFK